MAVVWYLVHGQCHRTCSSSATSCACRPKPRLIRLLSMSILCRCLLFYQQVIRIPFTRQGKLLKMETKTRYKLSQLILSTCLLYGYDPVFDFIAQLTKARFSHMMMFLKKTGKILRNFRFSLASKFISPTSI
jgi:hypothetical protein